MGDARSTMDRLTRAVTEERDPGAVADCYADHAVIVTPDAGEIRGRDDIVAYWRPFIEAFPDVRFEPMHQYEVGDTAIDEGWMVGTHEQPLPLPDGGTLPATGRQMRVRECDLATVRDGRITEHHVYFDTMSFLEQLGAAHSPAG